MPIRSKVLIAVSSVALIAVLAVGIVWAERANIARRFADAEFAARKVRATYTITKISTNTQRIEKLVIGDPAHPDLTVDWAEVELATRLSGVEIKSVRAHGVRLRGVLLAGNPRFGDVDRLLPAPTGKPFALPDFDVTLSDARMGLVTSLGGIGVRIDGAGNLANGFAGRGAVAIPALNVAGWRGAGMTSRLTLKTSAGRMNYSGPIALAELTGDSATLSNVSGTISGETQSKLADNFFNLRLNGLAKRLSYVAVRDFAADLHLGLINEQLDGDGTIILAGIVPDAQAKALMRRAVQPIAASPLSNIGERLQSALTGLDKGSSARIGIKIERVFVKQGEAQIFLHPFIKSQSGAQLSFSDTRRGIAWTPGKGAPSVAGSVFLSGGGFPKIAITARPNIPGPIDVRIDPYGDASGKIAFTPMRVDWGRNGPTLATVATVDAPLGGGWVQGLVVPISLRGGKLAGGCLPVAFQSYTIASLALAPTRFGLCLNGGQANIAGPRIAGKMGGTPLLLTAASAQVRTSDFAFTLNQPKIRLGDAKRMTALDLTSLSGSIKSGTASGQFAGASATMGNVPLLLSGGVGNWRFSQNILNVNGKLRVADAAQIARYYPLISNDFTLRFADGKITGSGGLREPKGGTLISNITLEHQLSTSTGHADLAVPGLTFGQSLQPEELSPITKGKIAIVVGTLSGLGQINWSPGGVTSSGGFRTNGLDFAAAFGPVSNLKGEIRLSDLLGLETPARQTVSIGSINPGIDVRDGEISYQILPGKRVAIEGGRWPFSGGALILEPTIMDLSESAERRMTFRVEGMDAARFIAQLDFQNIAATGTFDGTLPMIFDKNGGRIEGGLLTARGGGSLSYVGEISNERLGAMGRIAFDALKSIRYNRLSIELGGALDGDIVTKVRFAGVNQAPITGVRAKLPIPIKIVGLTNFPFIFNVTITAPFRQLFETARSINDPSLLIQRMIPQLQAPKPDKPVQPSESESMR